MSEPQHPGGMRDWGPGEWTTFFFGLGVVVVAVTFFEALILR